MICDVSKQEKCFLFRTERETEKDRERQRKTEKDRERQRKTEKDRERQREGERCLSSLA